MAAVCLAIAASVVGCGRSEKTTNQLDVTKLEKAATAKYCRTVKIPPSYVQKELEGLNLLRERKWDEQITLYTNMLHDESLHQFPDYRASIFAKLADAYSAKSKGKDVGSYLMFVSLALEQAESPDVKCDFLAQMTAISVALEHPEIGDYWRDAQARHNAKMDNQSP